MDASEAIVKVLIVASRYAWPPYSGDRLRTTMWIDALAGIAEATLIIPKGKPTRSATMPHVRIIHPRRAIPNLFSAIRRKLPLHTLMAAGYDWRGAIKDAGTFDAAIVILSRLEPWVGELPARFRVLDAIDALAHSMQERAREASFVMRAFWKREARAMEALERDAGARYDRVLLVNADESSWFGPRAMAIPAGVPILPPGPLRPRRYDFGFWGRLAYFANRDAALYLANEIWPRIRAALPQASLVIAGADAPHEIRQLNGRNGITVESPAKDIAQLARDITVGLFPIQFGTGQLTKILEAGEGGCAIVASPRAMRSLDALRDHVVMAGTADEFVTHAIALHRDPARVEALSRGVRADVERNFSREVMKQRLASVLGGAR